MKSEETLQFMNDFYPELFPTRKHAIYHLFCDVGNGFEWVNGELVYDDQYKKRYKLCERIERAEFRNEEIWNGFYKLYHELYKEEKEKIPTEYQFYNCQLSREYSYIYNYPENITSDWKYLLEECKKLLIEDGIEV